MSDFRTTLEAAGFIPRQVEPDGRWHRCPTTNHPRKLNGAYKLATCGTIGWLQDHAIDSAVATWKAGADTARPDPIVSHERAQEALNEHRRKLIQATHDARQFWQACKPLRFSHPYLSAKMLTMAGCDGLRVDANGWLIVPVMVDGNLMSLQRIAPDGVKRFWSGASVKGGSYIIQPRKVGMTALCEGLATGLAVYQSVPDCRVIVAFDCGNMSAVASRLDIHGLALVAADNDHATMLKIGKNPGLDHGHAAAQSIGCGIAWPTGIVGTDWADMLAEFTVLAKTANDNAARREQVRDSELTKMVANQIARELKRAAKFVPHSRAA